MYKQEKYYRHSGAIPPFGLLLAAAVGGSAGLIIGAAYGYVTFGADLYQYLPVFTGAVGVLVGMAAGQGVKFGKIRNGKAIIGLGLLSGLTVLYANWVGWIFARSGGTILIFDPLVLLGVLENIAVNGAWTISGDTPTGWVLYAHWIGEALILVGASIIAAWYTIGRTPFCERCVRWLDRPLKIGPLQGVLFTDRLRSSLEQGDIGILLELAGGFLANSNSTKLILRRCPKCRQLHLLTVHSHQIASDGNQSRRSNIVENLLIDQAIYDKLKWKYTDAPEDDLRPDQLARL